ncbi:MAG: PLP-dependent aspartate aminotransferase family protein [Candidatus Thermoplasmatota archaeon]|nr:PLP-dependent aspartate aminotransferase family protein [Candidatus Thermoplasmatota archaeon]
MSGNSTVCVHAGERKDATGSLVTPIYQTSTFYYPEWQKEYVYTRLSNPTIEAAESKLAALEGGDGCLVFSSGMAAITATLLSVLEKGDHLVSIPDLYGGTRVLLDKELPRHGIGVSLVDCEDSSAIENALTQETRAILIETPTNPLLRVLDMKKIAEVAHRNSAILVVDNTFATPINQRPLELGADVVVHSASKYLNGHSDVVAGFAVSSEEWIESIEQRRRLFGGSTDPLAAFLIARGMKTLDLRMRVHNENGMAVADALEDMKQVGKVHYPGLRSFGQHALAKRQMAGFGGMVSFEVGRAAKDARQVSRRFDLVKLASSLGGVESLASLPLETSHKYISAKERRESGIPDNLIRLSIGIENSEDIIEDLERAISGGNR